MTLVTKVIFFLVWKALSHVGQVVFQWSGVLQNGRRWTCESVEWKYLFQTVTPWHLIKQKKKKTTQNGKNTKQAE